MLCSSQRNSENEQWLLQPGDSGVRADTQHTVQFLGSFSCVSKDTIWALKRKSSLYSQAAVFYVHLP